MSTKQLSTLLGIGLTTATLGVMAPSAEAFTLTSTSGSWDNAVMVDGRVVGSAGEAASDLNTIEFLSVGDSDQVRWGEAVYGSAAYSSYDGHDYYYYDYDSHTGDYYYYEDYTAWYYYDTTVYYNAYSDYYYNYDTSDYYYYGTYEDADGQSVTGYYDYEVVTTYENKSGLGYEGVENLTLEAGEIFEIGTLTHYNQTIWASDNIGESAELSLVLDLGEGIGTQAFDFVLSVDETDNHAEVCPYETTGSGGCSDQITWDWVLDEANTFTHEGQEYTLELVGFADQIASSGMLSEANILNEFVSQEGGDNSASLFARLVLVDATEEIPEPASLLGLASFGLYFASSRRKKKAEALAV